MWRIFQLNKHLSKDGHAWSKFGSGNRESLSQAGKDLQIKGKLEQAAFASGQSSLAPSPLPSRMASPAPSIASATSESEADGGAVGRETRRRLVEWWSKEYCASRMNLAVIGKGILNLYVYEARNIDNIAFRIVGRASGHSFYAVFACTKPQPGCFAYDHGASIR